VVQETVGVVVGLVGVTEGGDEIELEPQFTAEQGAQARAREPDRRPAAGRLDLEDEAVGEDGTGPFRDTMKHPTSSMLHAYWNGLRGARAAPERGAAVIRPVPGEVRSRRDSMSRAYAEIAKPRSATYY
jgi:hypothetical protein